MKTRVLLAAGAAAAMFALPAASASAVTYDIVIPLTVVFGSPGSEHVLAEQAVAAELVGQTCTVAFATENNESLHPGTDLLVTSGTGQITLTNIEEAIGVTTGSGTLTLGSSVQVSARLGADGVASLGESLMFDCSGEDTGGNNGGGGSDGGGLPETGSSLFTPALLLALGLIGAGVGLEGARRLARPAR